MKSTRSLPPPGLAMMPRPTVVIGQGFGAHRAPEVTDVGRFDVNREGLFERAGVQIGPRPGAEFGVFQHLPSAAVLQNSIALSMIDT